MHNCTEVPAVAQLKYKYHASVWFNKIEYRFLRVIHQHIRYQHCDKDKAEDVPIEKCSHFTTVLSSSCH